MTYTRYRERILTVRQPGMFDWQTRYEQLSESGDPLG
jgi:hypothetical protein